MVSALVVANKIVELCNEQQEGSITHLKLQKLLYFVQNTYIKKGTIYITSQNNLTSR